MHVPGLVRRSVLTSTRWSLRSRVVGALVAVSAVGSLLVVSSAQAGSVTYTVDCLTVPDPDNPCMDWNRALSQAESHPGHDLIRFNIPGPGPHTIDIMRGNDEITDPVTIDGYSQPGWRMNTLAHGTNANVLIRFRGQGSQGPLDRFRLLASNSEIHGVAFTDFREGLSVEGNDNWIRGNVFGSVFGTMHPVDAGDNGGGIVIRGQRNRIGGDQLKDRNLISGNTDGIEIRGDHDGTHDSNVVVNSLIGTNAAGDQAHPNSYGVVIAGSAGNSIGLPGAANRNVISGNRFGVFVQGAEDSLGTTTENRVRNNIVGLDASGLSPVPNETGIASITNGSSANHFGGPSPGEGNVISGNAGHGVWLTEGSHQVRGNVIGLNVRGAPVPNGLNGVRIQSALSGVIGGRALSPGDAPGNVIHGSAQGDWAAVALVGGGRTEVIGNRITGAEHGVLIQGGVRNVVGGTVPADANVIHANRRNAVRVTDGSTQNRILGNSMYGNARLGIDLGGNDVTGDGVTANDAGDTDGGANNLQNYPRLDAAVPTAAGLRVDGSLHSTPNTEFVVQFFSQPSVGGPELRPCVQDSGHGEGRTVLGQTRVTTNSEGDARFSSVVRSTGANDWISATATGNENTSEFSECVPVSPVADLWVVKTQPPGATAGSNFTYTVTVRSKGPSPATSVVMEDTLQPTTTFVSMTWPPAWSCTHPAANTGGSIRCTRGGSLAAEGAEVFKIVGRVPSDTPDGARLVPTAATVSSPVSDPDLSNNRSSASFDVGTQADLGVVKTASPDVVRRGGALTYTLTVTNAGPSDAKNVRIEDPLAEELAFVSLTSPPDWTCATPDPGAFGTVACATAKLPAGAPAQVFKITVNARETAAGEIVNQAAVASETPDGERANNTSTVATPVSDDEPNPNGQGAVQATIAVAEDTPPPDEIRSIVVDPTAVAFGECVGKDGAAAGGMTYPNGKCVTPLISITNTGAPSSIHVLGADAVPSDAGPAWTLCYSASCAAADGLPGADQFTGRTFAPGGPGEQFLMSVPRCDYAFATTTAASPSCWATSGQTQTERVEIVGPEASSSAATSFSTTLTWIATP